MTAQEGRAENRGPLTLRLAMPPSVNNLFFNARGRGRVKTAKYRAWCNDAIRSIWAQSTPPREIVGPYRLTIDLPLKMRGDLDGRLKAAIDALVAAKILSDDSRVMTLIARRVLDTKDICRITVETER